ncbi:MAG: ABC transporter substrate-binding protein [Acetobacteraceae bacterium]
MKRRTLLGTAAVASLARPALLRAQDGPVRIGLMAPLTGVAAAGGREMVDDFTWFWSQRDNQVAGRRVEIVVEDDGSNPDTALQKARRLVEQGKVHCLIGNLLANTGLAVANYVKGTGTPYFIPVIAADDLTQRARIRNVVRTGGYTGSTANRPLADWALKQGYKKIATISQDYAFGHEQCGGLVQTFSEGGGQIVGQFWHPLNTSDFSPYLGQLAASGADAIFSMQTGADAARFLQQYSAFGLKGQIPLLGSMNLCDQSVIRTLGAEPDGVISAAHFAEGAETKATQDFVAAHLAKFGTIPSLYGFSMYSGGLWLAQALEAIGGRADDPALLIETVRKTELTGSPLGRPLKLDEYGQPIYDIFIRKVMKRPDGKYWSVPIETYQNVSQFWKYDPIEYMKQPPYSRSFQGIKRA